MNPSSSLSSILTEREALTALEAAAREVDRHFDPNNRGPLVRPGGHDEWIFGGKRVSDEASVALLILHDCLNDLRAAREECF